MSYPEVWFRGLTEKQRESLKRELASSFLSKRLTEILTNFERELDVNRKDYDSPNWAYKQAHYNGEILAYRKLLNLLRPKEDK